MAVRYSSFTLKVSDSNTAPWFQALFLFKNLILSGYPSKESIKDFNKLNSFCLASNLRFSSNIWTRNSSSWACEANNFSVASSCRFCISANSARRVASNSNCWAWAACCFSISAKRFFCSSSICWIERCWLAMVFSATATFFSESNCFTCNCWCSERSLSKACFCVS